MAFAQLTYRQSLRDIAGCLQGPTVQALPHGHPRQCHAIQPCRCKRAPGLAHLCRVRSIAAFILVSDGLLDDVNILDLFGREPGSFYVMNRAYVDFERLFRVNQTCAVFVIRAKSPLKFKRSSSQSVDKSNGLICDQEIGLTGFYSRKRYPRRMRIVCLKNPEIGETLGFLTNNFELTVQTVCDFYRSRWQVELVFKWIKQHLRIKQFFGRSENAVKCQIWIAVATYLLVAIARKRLRVTLSLHSMFQMLSVTPVENIS